MLDHRSLSGYLNAWNARTATSFDLANAAGIDARSGVLGALVADLKRNTANIADAVRNFVSSGSPAVLASVGRFSQAAIFTDPVNENRFRGFA